MKIMSMAFAFCFVLLAAVGCGGGGGGGSGGGAAASIAQPPYTLTPAIVKASYVAGTPVTITMSAKQTVAFVGVVYVSLVADAAVIQSPVTITTNPDGTLAVQILTSATLTPGHYAGNVTVNVCTDPNCNSQLLGSPFLVPYVIDVISPNGGVTAYNLSPLSPLAGATDWETFQANASHTGFVPVTLNAAVFNPRWKWDAPSYSGVQWNPSTITTGGGRFYVSSGPSWIAINSRHELFAYKEDDGSQVWSHSFADLAFASTNPPAFSNGKVYMAAGSQQSTAMFAFDAGTGAQIFTSPMASQWENYLAPTILNNVVYSDGGRYGGMYAFDTATGLQKFTNFQLGQYDKWTPAVDASFSYTYVGGSLKIVDIQTGLLVASIADPNHSWNGITTWGAPVIGAAGSVFAGNLSSSIFANAIVINFDTVNKTVRWSAVGAYSGNPAYAGGTLFVPNNKPFALEAHAESDGATLWSWTPPSESTQFVSDVLITNNLLFVSTDTNTYAIDRTTHASVWKYPASGALSLSANGILYIKGTTSIVAINLR
jgi:outer membrane protein assembly factor BamB